MFNLNAVRFQSQLRAPCCSTSSSSAAAARPRRTSFRALAAFASHNTPQSIQHHHHSLQLSVPSCTASREHHCKQRHQFALNAVAYEGNIQLEPAQHATWLSRFQSVHDKDIVSLAIPAFLTIILAPLMGLVDTAIVGRLGSESLGAVGLSTVLFNTSNFLFSFLMWLTPPRVAAAMGRNQKQEASQVISQSLWLALVFGAATTVLLLAFGPTVIAAMRAQGTIARQAVGYLRGRCIANPAMLAFFVLSGSFRGLQDTRTPLIAAVASNVINLTLDIFFIFGLHWGVVGAALATSIAQYASVGILLWVLHARGLLHFRDLQKPPAFKDVRPILENGLRLSLRSALSIVIIMVVTSLCAGLGTASIAAHEVLRQTTIFFSQAFLAFDIAAQSIVAKYVGRGDKKTGYEVLMRVVRIGATIGSLLTVVIWTARWQLAWLFTSDPAVVSRVLRVIPVVALCMPIDAMAGSLEGGLMGASDTSYVANVSIIVTAVVLAFLGLQARQGTTLLGIWFSFKWVTVLRGLFAAARFASPDSPFSTTKKQDAHEPQRAEPLHQALGLS